jgi:hypothetical protein
MGLITETNEEYYAGEKVFLIAAATTQSSFETTFNTEQLKVLLKQLLILN